MFYLRRLIGERHNIVSWFKLAVKQPMKIQDSIIFAYFMSNAFIVFSEYLINIKTMIWKKRYNRNTFFVFEKEEKQNKNLNWDCMQTNKLTITILCRLQNCPDCRRRFNLLVMVYFTQKRHTFSVFLTSDVFVLKVLDRCHWRIW